MFFEVTPITASRSDYQVLAGNVSLAEGQRTAAVPVNVVNDQIPEFSETFTVRLLAANLQGGAKLGSPVECTVTIEENDYPYGLMGMSVCFYCCSFTVYQQGRKTIGCVFAATLLN